MTTAAADKQANNSNAAADSSRQRTKLVIRHLPIDLTQEQFNTHLAPYQHLLNYTYLYTGKIRSTVDASRQSVAYVNVTSPDNVYAVVNHLLHINWYADSSIHTTAPPSQARVLNQLDNNVEVEYAPYQLLPRPQHKPTSKAELRDSKLADTYETDTEYQDFIQELQRIPSILPSAEKQLELREAEEKKNGGVKQSDNLNNKAAIIEYLVNSMAKKKVNEKAKASTGQQPTKPQSQAVQKETEKQQVAANKKYKAKAVLLDEDKARRKQARKAKRIAERLRKLQARAAADNCESTPANDANKQVDPSASAKSKKYRAKDELPPSKVQSDKTFASIAASQDSKANRQQPAPRPGTSDSSVAKKRPEPHITSTAAGQLTSNSQTSPRSSPSAPPASRGGKRGGKGDKQPKFAPKPSAAAS